jgi:hypothetical protein
MQQKHRRRILLQQVVTDLFRLSMNCVSYLAAEVRSVSWCAFTQHQRSGRTLYMTYLCSLVLTAAIQLKKG